MEGQVVTEIASLAQKPTSHVFGDNAFLLVPAGYTPHDPASLIKPGPQPAALPVSTLGAFKDYVAANRDGLELAKCVAHVVSPVEVRLLGPLNARDKSRDTYLTAKALDLSSEFLSKFVALEDFILGLQVRFTEEHDRLAILKLLSNVKSEVVKTSQDDGVSQTVTAKAGVALVQEAPVPNPVTLAPFRTFRDVAQPQSKFVLRVRQGHELPSAGLFEADGGAWKLDAIAAVRGWLSVNLSAEVAVLA